jgi:glycosyltransferase 2 family protein
MDSAAIPLTTANPVPRRSSSRWLRLALGYGIAVAGLAWVLHDVDLYQVIQYMLVLDWRWVVATVLLDLFGYFCQGLRWELLLRPLGKLSPLRTTQAVYAGLFTNEILPMRVGEVARAYLVSRWLTRPMAAILPSMAIERLFDAMWFALAMGITAIVVPLPPDLAIGADVLGAIAILGVVLFLYLLWKEEASLEQPEAGVAVAPWRAWIRARSREFHEGIRRIGFTRTVEYSFAVSLVLLLAQAAAFWAIVEANGVAIPIWAGVAVFLIIHLGTALPNAPANVGSYQFFCVLGLTLFGVEKTRAVGLAFIAFLVLTIPLWLLGAIAWARSGMSLSDVRTQLKRA